MKLPHGLDPNARGIAGQIGQGHILDIDDLDRFAQGPCGDGGLNGAGFGVIQRFIAADFCQGIDAVHLARDLGNGSPHRVGDSEMVGLDDFQTANRPIDQDRPAADDDDR